MKKVMLAAVLATAGVAAHAQSSVTLYGRLDAGIEYMNGLPSANGGSTSRWRAESGNWGTSLWGLKGSEDIGGGNKIVFQLEGSFDTMNGNGPGAGSIWNRWATVGISNDTYGTLLLGRELAIANGVWDFDPFGQSSWSTASLVRGRNWNKTSNNISYQSPKLYGFDVYGQYALSNATNWNGNGSTSQGRSAGLQLTYTTSLFQVRGLYDEARDPANGKLDDVFNYSREYFAGVNVFLGQFKIQAAYQTSHADSAPVVNSGITSTQQVWGGVTWQATPAAALIAAAYHVNANHGGGNANIFTVGGTYNLSKRTLLDMQVATVRNSKTANFGLNANPAGTDISTGNPKFGGSQTGVYAGIQHLF
ncbi:MULTISPECIES: porin [Burkholderia]|uniref:Porin n=2 Tax=Burkholderia humptydooensis TaxID=430531 RepID=A0A7U4P7I5_9BURK|nr:MULTISPECIES: porin [Burkholderia]AGK49406.1 gram-negative porin family protein [Burkholderia thailandensis MSMB121]AJY41837.1 gram-negative porin family protein [Burkholderia sp. 2002721687]ALX44430.1 porin [Burkholderia humptydooensis]KST76109.1 porin [Burkholderia humptydooensis]KVN11176.1 porin [Burkholderia sp. MSMB1552]